MAFIIDRRDNTKGKNHGNRQRFIRRASSQIKEAVKNIIKDKSIKDLTNGQDIKVPVKNIKEPVFSNDPKKGVKNRVHPGNKQYIEEDLIEKPQNGAGKGNQASDSGDFDDEFVFSLSKEEFLDIFFEDLELPNLTKQKLKSTTAMKLKRAGYTNVGNPTNIHVEKSTKLALSRRIALKRPKDINIIDIEKQLEEADEEDNELIDELNTTLINTKRRLKSIPWIDPVDIRYRNFTPQPKPTTQAVMISIMDVSGSMGEKEKDIAKRFFLLLHMFLSKKYEKVDIIFIRHTHVAQEVDEETFFYDRTSGGTIVSKALEETIRIIKERYDVNDWNIYCAQCSDGDNYERDSELCTKLLNEHILPISQYMAYIEIANSPNFGLFIGSTEKELWKAYSTLQSSWDNFQIRKISSVTEIYPVFRELFAKENL